MKHERKGKYLLLDSWNEPVARGILESSPGAATLRLSVLDGKASQLAEHKVIQLVGLSYGADTLLGRVLEQQGDCLILEPLQALGDDVRENLRIPVEFQTFVYPLTGAWRGRSPAKSRDLSCGGIAFTCERPLEKGERVEIVIPITSSPLVLPCEILRQRPADQGPPLYAGAFVDLCREEEMLVREAVFSVQLHNRYSQGEAGTHA